MSANPSNIENNIDPEFEKFKKEIEAIIQKVQNNPALLTGEDMGNGVIIEYVASGLNEFKLKKFIEILTLLAKAKDAIKFAYFCGGFIHMQLLARLEDPSLIPTNDDGDMREWSLKIELEANSIGRKNLLELIKKQDESFKKVCKTMLVYLAFAECWPELMKYALDIPRATIETMDRFLINPELLLLCVRRTTKPCSAEDLVNIYTTLLKKGANVFHTDQYNRSCLNPREFKHIYSFSTDLPEQRHPIYNGIFTLLESGAGLLKKEFRYYLYPEEVPTYDSTTETPLTFTVGFKHFVYHVVKANKLDIEPKQFFEQLLHAEIVFKVHGQNRFIFNIKEFSEYLANYEDLSSGERECLRRIRKQLKALTAEQQIKVAPGISKMINDLFATTKYKYTETSSLLTQLGFPGNFNMDTQSLIFSYMDCGEFLFEIDMEKQVKAHLDKLQKEGKNTSEGTVIFSLTRKTDNKNSTYEVQVTNGSQVGVFEEPSNKDDEQNEPNDTLEEFNDNSNKRQGRSV